MVWGKLVVFINIPPRRSYNRKDTMSNKIYKKNEWPPDDEVIYVPDETYKSIYRALDHMEQARKELSKAAEFKKTDKKT